MQELYFVLGMLAFRSAAIQQATIPTVIRSLNGRGMSPREPARWHIRTITAQTKHSAAFKSRQLGARAQKQAFDHPHLD